MVVIDVVLGAVVRLVVWWGVAYGLGLDFSVRGGAAVSGGGGASACKEEWCSWKVP